ncbi:DUF3572 domain-containing protein [Terasakiella sp. A23]|uniref:DUF3572 domain-containing protein n=1 Tax=Terasakiella sp. FCG-A23 TaxID=3080561 RepID=UPI0029549324|nr:DUF3572 domain-containing protein [Terasakiella sp. A23]MDV7340547.1 DUF3572 domain-containing protein [Terasakiella sp. A23]
MKSEQAEIIAIQAITFIGAHEQSLNALMAQSGMGLDDLKENMTDPSFLAGVLDFLLGDEGGLLAFCDHIGLPPEIVIQARRALPGGENLWDG